MDEDWDDSATLSPTVVTDNFESVDSGRAIGKGRGFVPSTDDNEWSDNRFSNDRGGFRGRGGGRGGGSDRGRRRYDDNGSDQETRGGFRGRGGRGGGRRFNNDDDDGDRFSNRGRGGGGRGGFRNNSDDDDDSPRDRFSSRGGRGGGRGGFRNNNDDDDDDGPRERFSNRGRGGGGRGGSRSNNDDDTNENGVSEKPREVYIPPEPTDDEESMFSAGISSGINFSKYDNIKIQVTGENVPQPISSFEQSGMRKFVLENIEKSGYTKPTPVQKYAIPVIMAGRDLMACAQTGSGKTAAFLLPIVNQLLQEPRDAVYDESHAEPQAVIISPTRELTIQIYNEARKFAHSSILKVAIAYGGTASNYQAEKLRYGCHILVATPGRLNDYVNRRRITFASVRYFVLDEADRMLDMGFLPEIQKMLDHPTMVATGERQTLMFSATFPEEIQHLAAKFLHDYLFLTVGIVGGACSDVEQRFFQVSKFEKRDKLKELLQEAGNERTLVFVETKRNADFIAIFLSEQNHPTTSIHGDRLQRERETALVDFKSGRCSVLVATAVAARGLDIKGVSHVINYDLPKSIDEYVHRIGRTGRVGNRGRATSFYEAGVDDPLARGLVKILQQAEQEVPSWLDGEGVNGSGAFSGGAFGGRDVRKFNRNEDTFGTMESQGLPQNIDDDDNWG